MRPFSFIIYFFISATNAEEIRSLINPDVIDDEFYSETYTLFTDNFTNKSNNEYIYAQIGISNIGPGDQNGFCRIMHYRPGKNTVNKSILLKKSQWKYENTPTPRFIVGPCELSINQSHQLSFSGQIEDTNVHIILDSKVKNYSLPENNVVKTENNIFSENARYSSEIIVPWSLAKASAYSGKRRKRHSDTSYKGVINNKNDLKHGFGYADHSISTFLPSNLAAKWFRFRAINQSDSHLLLARYPDETNVAKGWAWQQNSSPTPLTSVTYLPSILPGIHFKTAFNKYDIKADQLIYRQATLEEKGTLGMIISKIVGNPVTYSYRASMQLESGKKIQGILEVSIADE